MEISVPPRQRAGGAVPAYSEWWTKTAGQLLEKRSPLPLPIVCQVTSALKDTKVIVGVTFMIPVRLTS